MKDYKRAYRRYMKHVKFIKRVNNWFCTYSNRYREEYKKQALDGTNFTFLRTTGRPCNCYMCSEYDKYKREQSQYIKRQIDKDMALSFNG